MTYAQMQLMIDHLITARFHFLTTISPLPTKNRIRELIDEWIYENRFNYEFDHIDRGYALKSFQLFLSHFHSYVQRKTALYIKRQEQITGRPQWSYSYMQWLWSIDKCQQYINDVCIKNPEAYQWWIDMQPLLTQTSDPVRFYHCSPFGSCPKADKLTAEQKIGPRQKGGKKPNRNTYQVRPSRPRRASDSEVQSIHQSFRRNRCKMQNQ